MDTGKSVSRCRFRLSGAAGIVHRNIFFESTNSMNSSPLSFSFELGPPRTPEAADKLPAVIARLAELKPDYFSVTYGAGGSTQDGTYDTIMSVDSTDRH